MSLLSPSLEGRARWVARWLFFAASRAWSGGVPSDRAYARELRRQSDPQRRIRARRRKAQKAARRRNRR